MFSAASVRLFVNTITSKRLHVDDETWRLGAMYKNLARVRFWGSNVKGRGHHGQQTKKCGILFGSRPLGRGPRAAFFFGSRPTPRGRFYAGRKTSACCLIFF